MYLLIQFSWISAPALWIWFQEGPGHIQTSAWCFISLEAAATSQGIQLNREHVTRAQSRLQYLRTLQSRSYGLSRFLESASQRWCICALFSCNTVPMRSELSFPMAVEALWLPWVGGDTQGKLWLWQSCRNWFRTAALNQTIWVWIFSFIFS